MKKINWIFLFSMLLAMSCQNLQMSDSDNTINPGVQITTTKSGTMALSSNRIGCFESETIPLMAAGVEAGTVTVSIDESNITLTYNLMSSPFFLLEVGAITGECNGLPTHDQFPFTKSFAADSELRFYTLTIPVGTAEVCNCIGSFASIGRYNPTSSQLETFLAEAETPYCQCDGPQEPADTVDCTEPKVIPVSAIGNEVGQVTITVNEANISLSYDLSSGEWFLLDIQGAAGACNGTSDPTGVTYSQSFVESDEIRSHNFELSLGNLPDCGCVTTTATLARYNPNTSQIETIDVNLSSLYCTCRETEVPDDKDLRTQTPGGWGAAPRGNNPGAYLHANFVSAFPSGLTVGCDFNIELTSAQAITNFLPQGGTPASLVRNYVDPVNTPKNVLASHVVALKLSTTFDLWDENFGESNTNLANAVVTRGQFEGWTVASVLAEGEKVLGGCPSDYTASDLTDVLSAINESNVDGTGNNGFIKNQ